MKKTTFIATCALAFTTLLSVNVTAQDFPELDKSPMDVAAFPTSYKDANKLVKITYSRPQLKDREVSKLAPMDKVWRVGANEAAEISFYKEIKLGKTTIKPGTYTFYLIPGEKEWTAIINADVNVWGSYFYNEANDVARLTVPVKKGDAVVEAFSIVFDENKENVNMHIGWGNTRLVVPFTK
ncbi:DUF2911 domain-containing protein [Bizionia gelidisalsuginis]|uniref:DUF2911 domain-containing protein n=2 Tax=Bizionia TaxID=283785 RepID=A0A8H2LC31_9FLAO|nr:MULTISPECIES: DUF2911 domain-containing protein [Bizionia]TYB73829.1 DUF2911 domain-containing protein [Bizionia saleffrena]TYC12791.1 DUF2911 domain-containing protein [Bizionia gelidisalsuginis]